MIASLQQISYERAALNLFTHNIAVALPITILVLKLFVRFVTREPAKDIFKSILVLPLDLVYVAYGLLLAGIAGRIPAFAAHYETPREADFAGLVLGVGLFLIACLITWLDRFARLLWQKFYAAWSLARSTGESQQMTLPNIRETPRLTTLALSWMFLYWAVMVPTLFLKLFLSLESLGGILKRLQ
jgi:hypothetical protein